MQKLKIFDAVEEVFRMDELQLIAARKQFDWRYLRQALEELREYIKKLEDRIEYLEDFIGEM